MEILALCLIIFVWILHHRRLIDLERKVKVLEEKLEITDLEAAGNSPYLRHLKDISEVPKDK